MALEVPTMPVEDCDEWVVPTVAVPAPLLVTVRQASQMLGLGRTSVCHLVRSGKLTPVRIGGAVRFSVDHLRAFVDAHATE